MRKSPLATVSNCFGTFLFWDRHRCSIFCLYLFSYNVILVVVNLPYVGVYAMKSTLNGRIEKGKPQRVAMQTNMRKP